MDGCWMGSRIGEYQCSYPVKGCSPLANDRAKSEPTARVVSTVHKNKNATGQNGRRRRGGRYGSTIAWKETSRTSGGMLPCPLPLLMRIGCSVARYRYAGGRESLPIRIWEWTRGELAVLFPP